MAREPLLNLSTLVEDRPAIRVDGEVYHLKSPDELTLLDSQRFTAWGKELTALGQDESKIGELEALVGVVAWAALVDMPRAVFDRLSSSQQMSLIEVFTVLRTQKRLRVAGALVQQVVSPPTGATSSPGSSAPLAATSMGGSTASQAAS